MQLALEAKTLMDSISYFDFQVWLKNLNTLLGLERYHWFARFLLDGVVTKQLEQFVPHLLSLPATMIKTWAK